jgi:starch synthase
MPSLFEPCGLNQMYSHAYGSIPIVSKVGGLKNTVMEDPYNPSESTGILFEAGDPLSLDLALERASKLYEDLNQLESIQTRIMNLNWSWSSRVKEYTSVYNSIIQPK